MLHLVWFWMCFGMACMIGEDELIQVENEEQEKMLKRVEILTLQPGRATKNPTDSFASCCYNSAGLSVARPDYSVRIST